MTEHADKQSRSALSRELDATSPPTPGKRTQVELSYRDELEAPPVQRASQSTARHEVLDRPRPTVQSVFGSHLAERGDRVVQRRVQSTASAAADPGAVRDAAALGTSGAGGPLPHLDTIQRSFGSHDVTSVRAHTDRAAAAGAAAMGASAFATGSHIAFAGVPDLHTAAHEAAHVIQQRDGVHLKGGVGEEGDAYEQHANAVADRVVAGQSAQSLLDSKAGTGNAVGSGAIQRVVCRQGGQYWSSLDPATKFDNARDARAHNNALVEAKRAASAARTSAAGSTSTAAPGPTPLAAPVASAGVGGSASLGAAASAGTPALWPAAAAGPSAAPLSPSPPSSPGPMVGSPIRPSLRDFIAAHAPVPDDEDDPLAVGEVEEYSATTAKQRGRKGDLITGDHIPSNASNQRRQSGGANKIRDQGLTLAVSDADHKGLSRTYGGRNKPEKIQADATNPAAAIYQDSHAYTHGLRGQGRLTAPTVGGLANLYVHQAARGIAPTHQTNDLFDHYARATVPPAAGGSAAPTTASSSSSHAAAGPGTSAVPPAVAPGGGVLPPAAPAHPASAAGALAAGAPSHVAAAPSGAMDVDEEEDKEG